MKTNHTPNTLTQASLVELAALKERPCLSLYQPTHRRHPENQQDPIRFGHLVKALETSLPQKMATEAKKALLAPFHALAEDRDFWNHTQDGLAVLSADGLFRVFMLQQPVAELAVVADSFHTKPLRQRLQSTERYQVLALGLHKVQLFEGDRHALDPVALAVGVPQMPAAELVDGYTGPPIGVSFDGGSDAGDTPVSPAHGGQNDDTAGDTDRFFRAVDRAVLDHHSRPSSLPLMLAALPEHHHRFREISHNPFLMATGLMADPHGLTHETLVQRAWEVAAPQQKAQQAVLTDAYAAAAAQGLGGENLSQVAHAAVAGRVATLLIEADRQVAGRIDPSTGRIDPADLANPRVDDVLDDLAALVESMGGVVHVLPADRMPCSTGVAATFRH
jgi:hypothetical protein